MIPNDFIDELLAKTDIVDVIEPYVPLKKSGANYMACCPFHQEKSASFSVSPTKQFYHCFGCGAHGSALNFIMAHQGLSFPEAVQVLADRVGMAVPQDKHHANITPEQRQQRKQQQQTLESVMQTAAQFYVQQLPLYPVAQDYLAKRGVSAELVTRFGIGYAPNSWTPLAQVFQPYPNTHLIDSGMVVDNEGKQYDRFRHRLMFPIRNAQGVVVGFGGRVLDDSKPKYLNSPDTPLFDKGKNLYGLYEARSAIVEYKRVLVVEGYMDVVALAQYGIEYAVATLGTATTDAHIKLLIRHSDDIYFCFDGDGAGKKAAWRALENALPQLKDGKTLHFLFLPAEQDPDSFIRQAGKVRFEEMLLQESQPLSQYFWHALTQNIDLNTQEGKADLIKQATPLLQKITAPALGYFLQQKLSELVGVDRHNLAQLMGQTTPKRMLSSPRHQPPRDSMRPIPSATLVQKQIRTLMLHPEWAQFVLLPDYVATNESLACLLALAQLYRHAPHMDIAQTLEHFRDTTFAPILDNIFAYNFADDLTDSGEGKQQEFQDGIKKIVRDLVAEQIQILRQKGSNMNTEEKRLLIQLLAQK